MNREKKLFKNTLIITIGKICTQLITFLLLPLYTGVLSTAEYGVVDLLNTLVSLCMPIVTLQIEQAIFRELIEVRNNELQKKCIISSGIITVIFQCVCFLVLFLCISPFYKNKYKYFLVINVIVYIFSSLLLQISRGLGDNKKYTIASFFGALFTIIFNIIFIVFIKLGASGMLLGTIIGQIIVSLYLFFSMKIYSYISIKENKKEVIKKLLQYSIPLIPNAISWWIFNASDRVIVTGILGVEKNGILAASLKFSSVYITLYNVFNISWTESVAMSIKDKDFNVYFNKTFNIVIRLFISLSVMLITSMPIVYPIMINSKFGYGYNLVPISILASLFNVIVGLISVIYVGEKNTKAIANTSIVSAVLNIFTHLILIKFIGLYAAVISTFISFFVMSIYRIIDINKRYIKIIISKRLMFETIVVYVIIFYLYYKNTYIGNIFSFLIATIFSLAINKQAIIQIFNIMKKN